MAANDESENKNNYCNTMISSEKDNSGIILDSLDLFSFRQALTMPSNETSASHTQTKNKRSVDEIYSNKEESSASTTAEVKCKTKISPIKCDVFRFCPVEKAGRPVSSSPSTQFEARKQLEQAMLEFNADPENDDVSLCYDHLADSITETERLQPIDSCEAMIDKVSAEIQAECSTFEAILLGESGVPQWPQEMTKPVAEVQKRAQQLEQEREKLDQDFRCLLEQHVAQLAVKDIEIQELKDLHREDIDRLRGEFEKALKDERLSAVALTEATRLEAQELRRALQDLQNEFQKHQEVAVQQAELLDEKSMALVALQREYEQVEDELLETLDQLDELKEEGVHTTAFGQLHIIQHEMEQLQIALFRQMSRTNQMNGNDQAIVQLEQTIKSLEKRLAESAESRVHLEKERDASLHLLKQEIRELQLQLQESEKSGSSTQNDLKAQHEQQTGYLVKNKTVTLAATFETLAESGMTQVERETHGQQKEEMPNGAESEEEECHTRSDVLSSTKSPPKMSGLEETLFPSDEAKGRNPTCTPGGYDAKNKSLSRSPGSAFDQYSRATARVEDGGLTVQKIPVDKIVITGRNSDIVSHEKPEMQYARTEASIKTDKACSVRRKTGLPTIQAHRSSGLSKPSARTSILKISRVSNLNKPQQSATASSSSQVSKPSRHLSYKETHAMNNRVESKISTSSFQRIPSTSSQVSKPSSHMSYKETQAPNKRFESKISTNSFQRTPSALDKESLLTGRKNRSRLPVFGQGRSNLPNHKSSSTLFGKCGKSANPSMKETKCSGTNTKATARNRNTNGDTRKTSPKDLIKNVLDTMSPNRLPVPRIPSTPSCMPDETIDLSPPVEEKFESLFLHWSTVKKPSARTTSCVEESLPSSLIFDLSSAEKSLADKPVGCADVEHPLRSNKRAREHAEGIPSRMTPYGKPYLLSNDQHCYYTPLMVRNEVVDMFSPEDLLISPTLQEENMEEVTATRLSSAAVRIQSFSRMASAKRGYKQVSRAAMAIQARFRGIPQRRRYLVELKLAQITLKKSCAAIRIQSFGRMFLAKRSYARTLKATTIVQALTRGAIQRRQFLVKLNEERIVWHRSSALVRIQSFYRMVQAKQAYSSMLRAATTVQAMLRGFLQRRRFIEKIKQAQVDQRRSRAAVRIQSYCRMVLSKHSFKLLLRSTQRVQAKFRGFLHRRRFLVEIYDARVAQKQQSTAKRIQSFSRMISAKRAYSKELRAIMAVQAMSRGFLQRRCFAIDLEKARVAQKKLSVATLIQSFWRMVLARQSYMNALKAATALQGKARGMQQRRRFLVYLNAVRLAQKELSAAMRIQSFGKMTLAKRNYALSLRVALALQALARGFLQRRRFAHKIDEAQVAQSRSSAAMRIQSFFRMDIARKSYKTILQLCIILQAKARGMLQRRRFLVQRNEKWVAQMQLLAAMRIQSFRRMTLAKREYVFELRSVVAVQAISRGFLQRRRFVDQLNDARDASMRSSAVVHIQAFCRMVPAKQSYKTILHLCTILQAKARGMRQRRRFLVAQMQLLAAMRIQSFIRMTLAKREYVFELRSVVAVQALSKGLLQRRRFVDQLNDARDASNRSSAVVRIQASCRMVLARKAYKEVFRVCTILQAKARGVLQRRRFLVALKTVRVVQKQQAAAMRIQCFTRMTLAKHKYVLSLRAVKAVQALLRGFLQRRRFVVQLNEVQVAQNWYLAAVGIQSYSRMVLAKRSYANVVQATTIIQAKSRGALQRRRFLAKMNDVRVAQERFNSAVRVQRMVRGWVARLVFFRSHKAVITIQSLVQRYLINRNVRERGKVKSVLAIQSWWRRAQAISKVALLRKRVQKTILEVKKRQPLGEIGSDASTSWKPAATKLKTRRGRKVVTNIAPGTENAAATNAVELSGASSRPIEEMKVVELREELFEMGIQKKELRNLRKAQLVQLLIQERLK